LRGRGERTAHRRDGVEVRLEKQEHRFAALAAVLGDGFDAQTREAWILAYNIVAETMLEGAAAARPIGS
jgi:hemoglobin-like flavoprotein